MRYKTMIHVFIFILICILASCTPSDTEFKLAYEQYTLENGLTVILHEDRSDPIASVAILYHVGSNREEKGRTGFAHLFEHMLFQESQHVGQDQFFKKIQDAGGTLNGGTWEDGTIYFEIIPNNALEMALWLEADRMGFLLSTVTANAFANQQEVVMNEKRQRVDNNPYGHTSYVIEKLLYPEDHPYNWQVIGSMSDLRNATLKDVRNFHKKWYGPNNATLVIAGDFDHKQTKQWVEKYFGEIKPTERMDDPKPWPVTLTEIKRAYHEDNFAKSPELNMVFPTIEQYTTDAYALNLLGELFSEGKKAPLYKVIVEEKKLAPSVSGYNNSQEITGYFRIRIRSFPGKNLTDVEKAVAEALQRFETDKFTEKDLAAKKAKTETTFYNGIASIFYKAYNLASYSEYAHSPGFISQDLKNIQSVSSEDVWRVYNKYIKDKPYVLTSFVPKGQTELIADNSTPFQVEEESVDDQKKVSMKGDDITVEKISTAFDRSVEPPKGPDPLLKIPAIWDEKLANGLQVYGIEHNELPLITFTITLRGGMLCDDINKIGVANLMTDIMMEGTKNKTPIELEEAMDELGANINMSTSKEAIVITANTLASKFDQTYALVQEILLEPRWDEKEFERLKNETIELINRRKANPNAIAREVYNKLLYGKDHILSNDTYGTSESVNSITIDDVKNFYQINYSPSISYISVVGAITKDKVVSTLKSLEQKWPANDVNIPEYPLPAPLKKSQIYFVDFPGAKQSVIYIGNLSLAYTDADFYPASVMNYKLGGSFSGRVNLILREEKGYTYGARTRFNGSHIQGPFTANSSVQSNATFESVKIFKEEMEKYRQGVAEEDLAFTKNALIKSNSRRFETLPALVGMLNNIAKYDLPKDYIKQRESIVREMTLEQHKMLAEKYIDTDKMIYLIVGDAKTQYKPLQNIGFGKPIMVSQEDISL
jgi:zinc protease